MVRNRAVVSGRQLALASYVFFQRHTRFVDQLSQSAQPVLDRAAHVKLRSHASVSRQKKKLTAFLSFQDQVTHGMTPA
jgi:hypothetical protein